MILPDVNVLVYAFRREADEHEGYAAWLAAVVAGQEELALHDVTISGFVRIVTNRRIFERPAPTAAVIQFVDRLAGGRRTRWLTGGRECWPVLRGLLAQDRQLAGNLVPDALLAALAMTHGSRLATADRGFSRFPGLDWFDPIRSS